MAPASERGHFSFGVADRSSQFEVGCPAHHVPADDDRKRSAVVHFHASFVSVEGSPQRLVRGGDVAAPAFHAPVLVCDQAEGAGVFGLSDGEGAGARDCFGHERDAIWSR